MFLFLNPDACRIFAPQPGIESAHPALEGLNHWTVREVPGTAHFEAWFEG